MSKLRKILKYALVTVLALVVLDVGFVLFFPKKNLPEDGTVVDAIVVLGAAPNSPAIQNRAWHGFHQYEKGLGELLVFSGGKTRPEDETEARNMSRFLANRGALANQVLEEESGSTWENLLYTKQSLPENYSILVVSDTYHLPRAVMVAKALGFEDVYWSAPSSGYYRFSELVGYYVREMVAIPSYLPKIFQYLTKSS